MDQVEIRQELVGFFMEWLRDNSIFGDGDVISKAEWYRLLDKAVKSVSQIEEGIYAERDCLLRIQRTLASQLATIVMSGRIDLLDFPSEVETTIRAIQLGYRTRDRMDVCLQ